ncbi:NAD-dependent deacetylase [Crossiella equi]|uniref:protein acetyllysine N-acetyltransferase n=1 Tax=Crossiella equi TaxID=130796 RepID=A0ABS5AB95_9PSEU|nr:Sir2 family NAD-dependent protein deacetylase [Crossiella equi]MBP2473851.1 NAD-dependent deacetylase [Crossiella equi]
MTDWMRGVRRIAVLTGAGLSTDSGVPDYRGPDGEWTRSPEAAGLFTAANFLGDPEVRARLWRRYLDHPVWRAEPNAAHRALAELAGGPAVRVLTQNVDGLHQRAGVPARKVFELHGNLRTTGCVLCGTEVETRVVLDRVRAGEADPSCVDCGGVLKPGIVLFGEHLDPEVIGRARTVAAASELFLAVGSSLQVEPAASLCTVAVAAGARLVVVNNEPTPYDGQAVEVVREPIGEALPRICAGLLG